MSWLKKIIKPFMVVAPYVLRNSQTVSYPTERLMFAERFRGRHKFHIERCTKCGLCSRICPCNSIELVEVKEREGRYPQIDYQTCSLCGYCVEFCPVKALEFTDFVEYAESDRGDLVYPPERLAKVPEIKEVLPMLERRIESYLTETEMKYKKVEEL